MRMSYLGLDLIISAEVFAPTPTSHLLGDAVLDEVREADRVLDMGTGSCSQRILAASRSEDVVGVDVTGKPRFIDRGDEFRANTPSDWMTTQLTECSRRIHGLSPVLELRWQLPAAPFTRCQEIFGGELVLLPMSDMPSDEPVPLINPI